MDIALQQAGVKIHFWQNIVIEIGEAEADEQSK